MFYTVDVTPSTGTPEGYNPLITFGFFKKLQERRRWGMTNRCSFTKIGIHYFERRVPSDLQKYHSCKKITCLLRT